MKIGTRGGRKIAIDDNRNPMLRLLVDGQDGHPGHVEVYYDQQWRTLFLAIRKGYLDENADLTTKGRTYLKMCGMAP